MRYDLVIVGAGPAGITASVYAARKKMRFLVISKDIGGQATLSSDIENYTGYQFITGPELVQKFKEHLEQFDVTVKEGETAVSVKKKNEGIHIQTDKEHYESKTVIVASGRLPRKLNAEGEGEFKNRGVAYCATCDAPLFSDMDVAVIGGGNAGLDATLQLINIAKKIYLIEVAPELRADPIMVEKARASGKVLIYTGTKLERIYGDNFVQGIKITKEGEAEDIAVEGVFIEIGSIPASDFVEGVEKNEAGEIIVNCRCETNVPEIFAAGDVTNVPSKQIIVAAGDGAKATLSVFEYLIRSKT